MRLCGGQRNRAKKKKKIPWRVESRTPALALGAEWPRVVALCLQQRRGPALNTSNLSGVDLSTSRCLDPIHSPKWSCEGGGKTCSALSLRLRITSPLPTCYPRARDMSGTETLSGPRVVRRDRREARPPAQDGISAREVVLPADYTICLLRMGCKPTAEQGTSRDRHCSKEWLDGEEGEKRGRGATIADLPDWLARPIQD